LILNGKMKVKIMKGKSLQKGVNVNNMKDYIEERKVRVLNNYNKCHLIKICMKGV